MINTTDIVSKSRYNITNSNKCYERKLYGCTTEVTRGPDGDLMECGRSEKPLLRSTKLTNFRSWGTAVVTRKKMEHFGI